jgi:hypothetical protein
MFPTVSEHSASLRNELGFQRDSLRSATVAEIISENGTAEISGESSRQRIRCIEGSGCCDAIRDDGNHLARIITNR